MKSSTPFILLMVILVIILCSCAPSPRSVTYVDEGTIANGVSHYSYHGCEYLIASFSSGVSIVQTANQPSTCKDY